VDNILIIYQVIMFPISGLRRVMVKMWRDNRIRVGIWRQELGTRRKRRWKRRRRADEHHDDVNGLSLRDGHLVDDLLNSEWPYLS
jgi:hypothetical protein